ncbi:MAG TPA: hypothetical protein VF211_11320 [Burkholderiales bacterium]
MFFLMPLFTALVAMAVFSRARGWLYAYLALVGLTALKALPLLFGARLDFLDLVLVIMTACPWSMFLLDNESFQALGDTVGYRILWALVGLNVLAALGMRWRRRRQADNSGTQP